MAFLEDVKGLAYPLAQSFSERSKHSNILSKKKNFEISFKKNLPEDF